MAGPVLCPSCANNLSCTACGHYPTGPELSDQIHGGYLQYGDDEPQDSDFGGAGELVNVYGGPLSGHPTGAASSGQQQAWSGMRNLTDAPLIDDASPDNWTGEWSHDADGYPLTRAQTDLETARTVSEENTSELWQATYAEELDPDDPEVRGWRRRAALAARISAETYDILLQARNREIM